MSGRNLILTGIPRAGTTLACRIVGSCPDTMALAEPMPVADLPSDDPGAAVAAVDAFFAACRESALLRGKVPSRQRDGQVPDNFFVDTPRGRLWDAAIAEIEVPQPLSSAFTLAIKHNGLFLALLPALVRDHEVIGIVRNPLALLACWQSIDLPVATGRLPMAERHDASLARLLDETRTALSRQVIILDWCFRRLRDHLPCKRVLRYEEIIDSGGKTLISAAGLTGASEPLTRRAVDRRFRGADIRLLQHHLQAGPGAWRTFYSDAEVIATADRWGQAAS